MPIAQSNPPHPGPNPFRSPRLIFWTALLVRILVITLGHTYRIRPFQDHFQFGWEMGRVARALATGYGYSDPFVGHTGPTAWVPPLYPLLMAAVFKIAGVYTAASAWILLAINSVFSAAIAPAIYEIAARCYGKTPVLEGDGLTGSPASPALARWGNLQPVRHAVNLQVDLATEGGSRHRVAIWSAWLWALYPAALQYAIHWVWEMSLTTMLFSFVLVLALRMRAIGETDQPANPQSTSRWLLFGLLWGLIALSNSSLLLFLPACGLWILLGAPRKSAAVAHAALASILFLALIAPWIWRNWTVFHAFIPMRSNLGAEFYAGSGPGSNGLPLMATLPLVEHDPETMRYKELGELAYVRDQGTKAKAYIAANPSHFAFITLKRIYFYWVSVPHPAEGSPAGEFFRELNYCFLSITGWLGLFLSIKNRIPAAWLFAWAFVLLPLTYYFVTVNARFRHPLEPLIAILTVYLFQSARPRKPKKASTLRA